MTTKEAHEFPQGYVFTEYHHLGSLTGGNRARSVR